MNSRSALVRSNFDGEKPDRCGFLLFVICHGLFCPLLPIIVQANNPNSPEKAPVRGAAPGHPLEWSFQSCRRSSSSNRPRFRAASHAAGWRIISSRPPKRNASRDGHSLEAAEPRTVHRRLSAVADAGTGRSTPITPSIDGTRSHVEHERPASICCCVYLLRIVHVSGQLCRAGASKTPKPARRPGLPWPLEVGQPQRGSLSRMRLPIVLSEDPAR